LGAAFVVGFLDPGMAERIFAILPAHDDDDFAPRALGFAQGDQGGGVLLPLGRLFRFGFSGAIGSRVGGGHNDLIGVFGNCRPASAACLDSDQ